MHGQYRRGSGAPQPSALIKQCAEELSRAMREDYITDRQGRRECGLNTARPWAVRANNCHSGQTVRTATREHMQVAFQQRRQQIVGDCRQLKVDVDSYNDNYNHGLPVQIIFDFTEDVEELEALGRA